MKSQENNLSLKILIKNDLCSLTSLLKVCLTIVTQSMIWQKKRAFFESVRKTQQVYVLHQKGVHSKNNLLRDLSVYVIQKFNGYEVSRQKLKRQQKCFFEPIDIVYDLIKENENIRCYFASDLALAYRTYYS